MDLLRLTHSGLLQQGSSLKDTNDIQGETEVSGIQVKAGDSFLPDRKMRRGHCSFSEPSHHRATELAGWFYI